MFIRIQSHRKRERILRILGKKKQQYFSFRRSTGYGVIEITQEEKEQIKDVEGFTVMREPYDDLLKCWG